MPRLDEDPLAGVRDDPEALDAYVNDADFRQMILEMHDREMRVIEYGPEAGAVESTVNFIQLQGRALQLFLTSGDVSGFLECAQVAERRGNWEMAARYYERAGDTDKQTEMIAHLSEGTAA